jgi:phosphopentomutase
MHRAIVIVMDGCGAGEAPDAKDFGDFDHPATLRHVWEQNPGISLPTLRDLGLLAACKIDRPLENSLDFLELSEGGKDSVTGHWEMAGIVTQNRFPTYPNGFPQSLVSIFERSIGSKVIGNRPASGTEIISELGEEHLRTGCPILYTSADSVFQLACHEAIVPVERLYHFCMTAREILVTPDNVQRVIARPFVGTAKAGFERTGGRRDFPIPPPPNLCDRVGDVFGIGVVPELFAGRGFRQVRRTTNNAEHGAMLRQALQSDARFIWANFEDFDMMYGHRNDVKGFGSCLEAFDEFIYELLPELTSEDILLLTADHGNDPTTSSTDHSREYVPLVTIGKTVRTESMPDLAGLTQVGKRVAEHLGLE